MKLRFVLVLLALLALGVPLKLVWPQLDSKFRTFSEAPEDFRNNASEAASEAADASTTASLEVWELNSTSEAPNKLMRGGKGATRSRARAGAATSTSQSPGGLVRVPVTSPACGPKRKKYLPQDPCCYGTGCCPDGKAQVIPGGRVTWTNRTDLVIVSPEIKKDKNTRPDARNSDLLWITEQKTFPYVLCPFCTVELDPTCSMKTNQGFEAAAYLAFVVYNYHRLPRTVAFVHGHPWVQNSRLWKKRTGKKRCTNYDRLLQLRPFLDEDMFIYIQAKGAGTFQKRLARKTKKKWELAFQFPYPAHVDNFSWGIGPHFVVGRNRILSRPREEYEKMFRFASGSGNYTDSKLAQTQGHFGAGAWFLEFLWNVIFNEPNSTTHPETSTSLRCQLGWCKDTHCNR